MKFRLGFFSTMALLLLCAFSSFGNGYRVLLQGNRQTGMGNTGVGIRPDAASIFFNPGAMSFMEGSAITAGTNLVYSNIQYLAPNPSNYTANTVQGPGTPFHLFGVYKPQESRFAFGLGVFTPFGSTVEWEPGWSGQFSLRQIALQSIFIQPTFSMKINDMLSVGGGIDLVVGSVNLQRSIPITDQNGQFGGAELSGDANGLGYNLGIFFQPKDYISFGLNYRSRVDMNVEKGQAMFSVPPAVRSNFPNTNFQASLPLPAVATFGVGLNPTDKLTLGADVSWVGWSAYETLRFEYEQPVAGNLVQEAQRNYRDAWTYSIGVEYTLNETITLRSGAYYTTTPVKDGYLTPETPDSDTRALTFGASYKIGSHLRVDASLLYINRKKRTDSGEFSGGIAGTYKAVGVVPGLSLTYLF